MHTRKRLGLAAISPEMPYEVREGEYLVSTDRSLLDLRCASTHS